MIVLIDGAVPMVQAVMALVVVVMDTRWQWARTWPAVVEWPNLEQGPAGADVANSTQDLLLMLL